MSRVSGQPQPRHRTALTPAEAGLSGVRAVCGIALMRRTSLLNRLQGARLVAQAGAEVWVRSKHAAVADAGTVYGIAAVVDASHGVSMLAFATFSAAGRRRRAALSAVLAALFTAGDLLVRAHAGPRPRLHPGALMEV